MNNDELKQRQAKHQLSEVFNEQIFREVLVPEFFENKQPSLKEKYTFYLAGQSGCGKSVLQNYLTNSVPAAENSVIINSDDIRTKNPDYYFLLSHPTHHAATPFLIQPDTNIWFRKLVGEAIEKGYNLLFDVTMGTDNILPFTEEMKAIKNTGYQLQLHIMAVKDVVSRLGCHMRYEQHLKDNGFGRFVPMEYHDTCFKNLPGNIKKVVSNVEFSKVGLYKRKLAVEANHFVNNEATLIAEGQPDDVLVK